MSLFTNTSFLCSYFSYNQLKDTNAVLSSSGWRRIEFSNELIGEYKNFFYPEFIDFSMGNSVSGESVCVYSKDLDTDVNICDFPVKIKDVRLYVMPYAMIVFAIHVDMESDSLDNFTLALYNMREKSKWNTPNLKEFHDKVLSPVINTAVSLGCESGNIIEMGNKLKVFQIVNTDERDNYGENIDHTLFELGILGKIGGCSANNPDSPSKSYIDRTIKSNRLSFFNNWTGLALFDTFTIMAYKVAPWMIATWIDDYFSMIYIHSLFSKFYLFRLNYRFRTNPENAKQMEIEYNEFERRFSFNKISYNFLPGEINSAMDRGLDISEEKKLIALHISSYNKEKDEEDSQRLDRILTFLAIVTVFSTIWDFSCMLNAMWPFESFSVNAEFGFRIVVLLTLLAVIFVIFAIMKRARRR